MNTDAGKALIDWLLEPADTGVRYLAMRDLFEVSPEELAAARKLAHSEGPIQTVLSRMHEEGYWEQPGHGYYPKYTGRSGRLYCSPSSALLPA